MKYLSQLIGAALVLVAVLLVAQLTVPQYAAAGVMEQSIGGVDCCNNDDKEADCSDDCDSKAKQCDSPAGFAATNYCCTGGVRDCDSDCSSRPYNDLCKSSPCGSS